MSLEPSGIFGHFEGVMTLPTETIDLTSVNSRLRELRRFL
jgi:hypothetical protein